MDRERLAAARIAAIGFLARRQIRSWLGKGQGSADQLEEWLRDSQNAGTYKNHIDSAESRFIELLALTSDVPPDVARAVRSAAVHFLAGANRLNTYVATGRPDGPEITDWLNLRNNAWKDLRDCVRILDQDVGLNDLLRDTQVLDAKRLAETPPMSTLYEKLADGIAKLDEGKR